MTRHATLIAIAVAIGIGLGTAAFADYTSSGPSFTPQETQFQSENCSPQDGDLPNGMLIGGVINFIHLVGNPITGMPVGSLTSQNSCWYLQPYMINLINTFILNLYIFFFSILLFLTLIWLKR